MWKKFFIAILSIALVGGASITANQLFAAGDITLQISDTVSEEHYINDTISFVVSFQDTSYNVQYIEGGKVEGNGESYAIPLLEDTNTFEVKGLSKPGAYHGTLKALAEGHNGTLDVEGTFTFTLYGKEFTENEIDIQEGERKQLPVYGILPASLSSPKLVYTSSDPTIVEVDEVGNITAKRVGDATITLSVYEGIEAKEPILSQASCHIHVKEQTVQEIKRETAINGADAEYRFIALSQVDRDPTKAQSLGFFQLSQSGEHAYFFEEDMKDKLEVRNNYLYITDALEEEVDSTTVYILHKDSGKLYKVPVSLTIINKEAEDGKNSSFQFRYNGEEVTSIIRPFQSGSNSFQLSSNQSIENVTFKLKQESDYEFLSVSQTGNVTVKKVTKEPVIILATYQKETYELPVTIEKSEQLISTSKNHITISIEDGAADPMILGRKGVGSLVLASSDAGIVDILMHEDGTSSIVPIQVGKAEIEVFNNGDENFKKSNVLTLQVEVVNKEEEAVPFQGKEEWLAYLDAQGLNHWHTEPVELSLQASADITGFLYQGDVTQTVTIAENGELAIPISFQNQEGQVSTPIKLLLNIDTQAPLISQIYEEDAANTKVKEFINQITFSKGYGRGKKITIAASDQLMDASIKTSGIAKISYQIYRVDEDSEELLLEGEETTKQRMDVVVEDTGIHKVCAYAIDNAGLQGEKTCQLLEEDQPAIIASENTGLLLKARKNDPLPSITILDQMDTIKQEGNTHIDAKEGHILAAYAFVDEQKKEIDFHEDVEIIIPITHSQQLKEHGIWKQETKEGSYEPINAVYRKDSCILEASSLRPIVYIETKQDHDTEKLLQSAKKTDIDASVPQTQIVTPQIMKSFTLPQEDISIFLYAGGALLIGLFVIVLIRCGKEEDIYE